MSKGHGLRMTPMQLEMHRYRRGERAKPDSGEGLTDSPAVTVLWAALQRLGGWAREFQFHPLRKWRLDFAHPVLMIAVEVEGGANFMGRHQRPEGFRDDMQKYNSLALAGWLLLRFTSEDVNEGAAVHTVVNAIRVASLAKELRELRYGNSHQQESPTA